MYNENSFKNHLFWIKVKRLFYMLLFSIIGSGVGVLISSYLVDILNFDPSYRFFIISGLTILFFALSLLLTANTGKEVQDGYWKIEVLRKLTLISNKLDSIDNLDNLNDVISQTKEALTLNKANQQNTNTKNNNSKENLSATINKKIVDTTSNNINSNTSSKTKNTEENKIINIEDSKKIAELPHKKEEKAYKNESNKNTNDSVKKTSKKKNRKHKRIKNKKIA